LGIDFDKYFQTGLAYQFIVGTLAPLREVLKHHAPLKWPT